MIIELRKYNSAEELLIGPESTGSPRQVYSRITDRRMSVTRASVRMKGTEDGTKSKGQGHIQLASESGMREDADPPVLEPEKGHQKCIGNKNSMKRGLEPPKPMSTNEVDGRQGSLHDAWLHNCHVMPT